MCLNKIKYLWIFSAADEWTVNWHEKLLEQKRQLGFDVCGFCNTPLELERKWLHYPELDRRWKRGDATLIKMYIKLTEALRDVDVLILYNGANLHAEFLEMLSVLKVYTAGDDPESTEILTKPVAKYFDIHLINNIACVEMYKNWGCKNAHFWPLGSLNNFNDVNLTEENIADISLRPIKNIFVGGYQSHRKDRFDLLTLNFPDAYFAGMGWPKGLIEWDEMWLLYKKSQIGWNFHNSTGPINFRVYELPAFGVMQICDNKHYLAEIYELDKEVIGFDNISECIEKTNYYNEHALEQRDIAVAGWKRWKNEYTPEKVWLKLVNLVEDYIAENELKGHVDVDYVVGKLNKHLKSTQTRRFVYKVKKMIKENYVKCK